MLRIVHQERDYVIGTYGRVILTLWRGEADEAAFARLNPVYDRMAETTDGFAFFTVMTAEAQTPTDGGRKALTTLLKKHEQSIQGAAVTVEGSGFKGAAIRSAVTGMALLARMPYPHRTHASVDDAADWFAEKTDLGLTAAELKGAVAQMRRTA